MPKDNKKRGRRAEQKRKRDDLDHDDVPDDSKRRRTHDHENAVDSTALDETPTAHNEPHDHDPGFSDRPFYGLLDDDEQEYFKRADDMLEVNQFANAEERALFVQNLHKEAAGKELKIACSQSCSRLLERLLLLSTPNQLKDIFQKLNQELLNLITHRFASHCCETLFIQSAHVVSKKLVSVPNDEIEDTESASKDPLPAMEQLFLAATGKIQDSIGYLLTDKFASHTIRVLLTVLSGQKLDTESRKSVHRSKRKERVDVLGTDSLQNLSLAERTVPDSFSTALEEIINACTNGLDVSGVRALATHPTGNPMLQLLLQLELSHFGKQRAKDDRSIIRRLFPEDSFAEGTESASFVNGLVYDPVGSRLLETVVEHAPGKMFKTIYKQCFKDRMGSLARNEIAGYVVCKILDRLSAEDLEEAMQTILPHLPNLAQRGRTNIMKTLVERCAARELGTHPLAVALKNVYTEDSGQTFSLTKLLDLPADTPAEPFTPSPPDQQPPVEQQTALTTTPRQNAASALAQAMIRVPGPLSDCIFAALSHLSSSTTNIIAITPALSPIHQVALTAPTATLITRRKLATRLYGSIASLSLSPAASHVIDAVEAGTRSGLAFVRERVAEELAEAEGILRESHCGRKVWRNWRMDLYRKNRGEWVRDTRRRVGNDGFQSFPGALGEADISAKERGNCPVGRVGAVVAQGAHEVKENVENALEGMANGKGKGKHAISNGAAQAVNGVKDAMMGGSAAQRRAPNDRSKDHNRGKTALQLARERYAARAKQVPKGH